MRLIEQKGATMPRRTIELPGFVLHLGVHPARSALPRHAHPDPTICYVMRGRFTEYTAGASTDCASETLKLMPAGEQHWNRFSETETRGLRIDVDRERFSGSPSIYRALDERRQLRGGEAGALARRLVAELVSGDDAGGVAAEGLALELLAQLSRARVTPAFGPWLEAARELVHEGYRTRCSLAEIAHVVGVQPSTLARAYRQRFGCTVGEHIRQLRVEHAARALVQSAARLTDIALDAGFYDQSHLTNAFRRQLGVTPAAYRRELRSRARS